MIVFWREGVVSVLEELTPSLADLITEDSEGREVNRERDGWPGRCPLSSITTGLFVPSEDGGIGRSRRFRAIFRE